MKYLFIYCYKLFHPLEALNLPQSNKTLLVVCLQTSIGDLLQKCSHIIMLKLCCNVTVKWESCLVLYEGLSSAAVRFVPF